MLSAGKGLLSAVQRTMLRPTHLGLAPTMSCLAMRLAVL